MKKLLIISLVLMNILFITGRVKAGEIPYRNASYTEDVFEPYSAEEWIVAPEEEPANDQKVSNAPECDIRGVIACYDNDYLRVDIQTHHKISNQWATFFGICFEYTDKEEYYYYLTDTKELFYRKYVQGKLVEERNLTDEDSNDTAGITDSDIGNETDIYLIINKKDHIGGIKGKRYYLTSYFVSGFFDENGDAQIADNTIEVNLSFIY